MTYVYGRIIMSKPAFQRIKVGDFDIVVPALGSAEKPLFKPPPGAFAAAPAPAAPMGHVQADPAASYTAPGNSCDLAQGQHDRVEPRKPMAGRRRVRSLRCYGVAQGRRIRARLGEAPRG